MIVDPSALWAILLEEPEGGVFLEMLARAERCRLSAASIIELAAVDARRFRGLYRIAINDLLRELAIAIEPVTPSQAELGRDAFYRFGQGSAHPARLTFGDCFAYALAKETGEPLLFKGDDFGHTDVTPARR